MKLSKRDRMLVVVLPAMLVFILYLWMFSMPVGRELKALHEQSGTAGDPAKIALDMQAAILDSDKVNDELDAEKKLEKQQGSVFPEQWKDSDRTRTLQELSRFFEASGVQMHSSSMQADHGLDGSIQELAKNLKDRYGAPEPQLWKFQLSGTYAKMADLLKRLGGSDRFIIPINVDMKVDSDTSADLSWTVVLWI